MENTKRTYQISGYTKANNYVTTGYWDTMKGAVLNFLEKYPRFKGEAMIMTQQAEVMNHMLLVSGSKWGVLDTFCSSKELKEYVGGE